MARFDLMDAEWAVIEPLLPTGVRGNERVDDRRVLNGIIWRLRSRALARSCGRLAALGEATILQAVPLDLAVTVVAQEVQIAFPHHAFANQPVTEPEAHLSAGPKSGGSSLASRPYP
ncbi:hypothetical protein J2W76_003474 [Methylorubrum zatmanii]|nr:hypothetical protein [Methylorubrum zatmanii]MCP1553157.1 hypothetical protein [Methylorubrum extorquens]MCP1580531.1 hypothetical protein [Methylorubrum extorquens]